MVKDYLRMADGITNLMMVPLDTEKTEQYISENYSSQEYMDILKYFYQLKDNYPDVYYMYVYKFHEAAEPYGTVIFDLDQEYSENPPKESIDWIGDSYVLDEPFQKNIKDLIYGGESVYNIVYSFGGEYLFSYAKPVFKADGSYAFSVCVDFNMEEVHRKDVSFVLSMAGLLAIFVLPIMYINISMFNVIL